MSHGKGKCSHTSNTTRRVSSLFPHVTCFHILRKFLRQPAPSEPYFSPRPYINNSNVRGVVLTENPRTFCHKVISGEKTPRRVSLYLCNVLPVLRVIFLPFFATRDGPNLLRICTRIPRIHTYAVRIFM